MSADPERCEDGPVTIVGPTMGCIADDCAEETWPDVDWLIIDTPVGSFEVLMCDSHDEQFQAGTYSPCTSWARAVELVLEHPVVHADAAIGS